MAGASLSKWPSAVMISGLVNDGTMSYDDKASKYLKWWATDPSDPRSAITLRHLLSFTSGFDEDAYEICPPWDSFDKCTEKQYEKTPYNATISPRPGTHWAYLSCHLQFAGAMAAAASGKDIQALFGEYLYKPYNMTSTSWSGGGKNPSMAAGITTTGADFENMMQRLLTASVLGESTLAQMETDWSKEPCHPSGDGWFGHYGMGHWWECLGYGDAGHEKDALPAVCADAAVQAGPGEFGWYPLLDRSGGGGAAGPARQPYYMQVILQEPDALSGIPEYLRVMLKPLVDQILAGNDPAAGGSAMRQQLLDQGAGLLVRDIDYIEQSLKSCTCSGGSGGSGGRNEPFHSLSEGMPKDDRHATRREIASKGVGLLLHELIPIQQKLGNCTCKGRTGL